MHSVREYRVVVCRRLTVPSLGRFGQSGAGCGDPRRKEVCGWLRQHTFELVISEMHPMDGTALWLIPLMEGSPGSLFCFHPIEDSCL